jgi:hypothetical protein
MSIHPRLIPKFRELRETIDHVPSWRDRIYLKYLYLTASRYAEAVTKAAPSDSTKAYGSEITWDLEKWQRGDQVEQAFCVTVRCAKKKSTYYKVIGLPVQPHFEPWTKDLLQYLVRKKTLAIDLGRDRLGKIVRQELRGQGMRVPTQIKNPLRHYRLTHLSTVYDMRNPIYMTSITGHSSGYDFRAMTGTSLPAALSSYLHSLWRDYFHLLLKPYTEALEF